MAERYVIPRHPLDGRAGVVGSCGRLWRWRVVVAAATRSRVRRLSAATWRSSGTDRRWFQANLLKARTCLCPWGNTSSNNGQQRDERGHGLQVFARSTHGFHPRTTLQHCPRRRSHCLGWQKCRLVLRTWLWGSQEVNASRLANTGERRCQLA